MGATWPGQGSGRCRVAPGDQSQVSIREGGAGQGQMLGTWSLGLIQGEANGVFLNRGEAELDDANPGVLLPGPAERSPSSLCLSVDTGTLAGH